MSAVAPAPLRTLAFGDLSTGVWGLVWSRAETVAVFGTLTDGDTAAGAAPVTLAGAGADGEWRIEGDGLVIDAIATGAASDASDAAEDSWVQLCRVAGQITLGGREYALACPGLRTEQTDPDLSQLDSYRQVLAWFSADDGLALSAARPRGAPGQEQDEMRATVFDPDGPAPAHDARLSTTYAASGSPARIGLELWLTGENDTEYPVRAAGEVIGAAATGELSGSSFEVHALRAHRGGRDGVATYLIARSR
jgi:hypothetical protein